MPRDLADVFHYFLPESDAPKAHATSETSFDKVETEPLEQTPAPAALPILGIPIGERDVVRAALAWNLAIETARLGGSAAVVAPAADEASPLWPEPGMGPLGTELVLCSATDLEGLYAARSEEHTSELQSR